ncbi:hypothetical protein PbDSM24746_54280 [Paenibacillus macerans]|nr:hypothetical protein PbDSM24746_54280 [Paenibacillus macerans]GBK71719.1 hypothetical protein PbJCM17693_54270 [Paenibacillus macerans]GIP11542.1 hypothetical protein J1TS5_37120 [Paenibacillus macerans]
MDGYNDHEFSQTHIYLLHRSRFEQCQKSTPGEGLSKGIVSLVFLPTACLCTIIPLFQGAGGGG